MIQTQLQVWKIKLTVLILSRRCRETRKKSMPVVQTGILTNLIGIFKMCNVLGVVIKQL